MYAIFRTGSKQYRAAKGDTVELDRQRAEEGGVIEFPEVVFYNDGENSRIGTPTVSGEAEFGLALFSAPPGLPLVMQAAALDASANALGVILSDDILGLEVGDETY